MKTRPPRRHAGFTLTEILVAMVIALIGVVMMFQIMENSETRKRTTGAGSDAQVAGAIAIYSIERDLRGAGNGFGYAANPGVNALGCTVNAYDTVSSTALTFPLVPVLITNGAANAPDVVTVFYGNADVTAQALDYVSSTATSKKLTYGGRGGVVPGDLMISVSGTTCDLLEVSDNTNADAVTIDHTTGTYQRHYQARKASPVNDTDYEYESGSAPSGQATARYNAPAGTPGATSGMLFNLGRRDLPRRNVWQVVGTNLTVRDTLHNGTATAIGDGVIDMQAEYGLSTTTPPTWQATAPADWSKVVAVRVVLLARSQQYEKEDVTTVAPTWTNLNDAATPHSFIMTNIDGTPDSTPNSPNNWRRYRYRVYETVIPMRNTTWGA